jgi:D-alanyl-D-alanine carboxypeptidase (penicillin-binding protein 5/6)
VVATRRPTLYSMQAGPRRRRPLPRASPLRVVAIVVLLVIALAAAVVVWRVLPLTDTGAGVIPETALTGVVPDVGGGGTAQPTAPLAATAASTRPIAGVGAAAAVLVDAGSGRVLWMHHPHERRAVASLTKLMTAWLAARRGPLDARFTVTPAMTGELGYTIGITSGSRVSVRDMLAASLIASANDAADALAVHRSGSVARFVRLMNHEARRLGLSDTRYSNPSGIVDTGNSSSAWDVADLARHVMAVPALRKLVGAKVYRPQGGGTYVSRNQLLWTYPDATGIKTGQTTRAGNCLAASARRHGHLLVAVLLGAHGDEFAEASRLLDWGFTRVSR